jgi:hypothetical protein
MGAMMPVGTHNRSPSVWSGGVGVPLGSFRFGHRGSCI